MDLVTLISNAVDALSNYGNMPVNVETIKVDVNNLQSYNRKVARCTDIQIQKKGFEQKLFVVVGGKDNDFIYE